MKMWETPLSWHAKFSLPVAVRVLKTSVLKLPIIFPRSYEAISMIHLRGFGLIGVKRISDDK